MRKLGALVVTSGMMLGALAAHAAPPQPAPTATPKIVTPGPAVALRRVEAAVVPVPSKCGEPIKARVVLRNKTLQDWMGNVNFVANGSSNVPVHLASSGVDAEKTIDLNGGVLDCKKPLGTLGVRVWKEPTSPILVQVLRPKRVFSLRDLTAGAPLSNDPRLRRVVVDARCGEKVSPLAVLHTTGPAQQVMLKLEFGTTSKTSAVQVAPNQATQVPLDVPGTLDCQAQGGIPSFRYELLTGNAMRGMLEPNEVTFE